MKRSWLVAAGLALCAGAPAIGAHAPDDVLTIPGGISAFRQVAGLGGAGYAPGAVIADYARVYYKSASDETTGTRQIEDYFEFLEKLTAATSGWKDGVSFASADASKSLNEQLKDFADLAGVRLRNVQDRRLAELESGDEERKRQAWLAALGIDLKQLVARLNDGDKIQCPIPSDQVPLPHAALFRNEVFRGDRFPVLRLVSNRSASLFYVGMMSLDGETRAFVEADRELGRRLLDGPVAAFAVFGRNIRVRGGAPSLPGGPDAVPIWESLAGERVRKTSDFIKSAMEKDDGRLAYFLDVVTHLDDAHQRFMLGASLQGKARVEFVRDVYESFKGPMDAWKVQDRPFLLPGFGSALAIAAVDLTERGTLGPDWFPGALALVDDSHDSPAKVKARKVRAIAADGRWFFQWLNAESATARRRFALLRFAQRRLIREPALTPEVESMLRIFSEMPSLALTVERLGVQSPALYSAVGAAAWTLFQSGDRESVEGPMRRWQAALALLEQASRHQRLPAQTIEPLLRSLAAIAALPPDRARGRIADWVSTAALPAIAPDFATRPGATVEARALHALVVGPEGPQLNWEGLSYRLATSAVAARNASAIREAAPGPAFGDVEGLRGIRNAIAKPLKPEQLPALAERLRAIGASLAQLKDSSGRSPDLANDLADWAEDWRKLKPKDVSKAAKLTPKISTALDELTSIVLPRMVYALAVSPTSQPPAIFATLADRHDVTPAVADGDWRHFVWSHERSGDTVGGSLRGTLLGLDVELADSQPRDIGSAVVAATQLNRADHDTWLARLAISRADAAADEQARNTVADAMRRGRAEVARLIGAGPPGAQALESALIAAGTSETRAALAALEVRGQRPANVAALLRPMDFYQIGTATPWPAAWGSAAANMDGCLCLTSPMRRTPESWLGYPGTGVLAASITDGSARLAEVLTEMKLPGWLMSPLLPFVTAGELRHTKQFGPDDWDALLWSRKIDAARVEEWLLALIAEGILAPPSGGDAP